MVALALVMVAASAVAVALVPVKVAASAVVVALVPVMVVVVAAGVVMRVAAVGGHKSVGRVWAHCNPYAPCPCQQCQKHKHK